MGELVREDTTMSKTYHFNNETAYGVNKTLRRCKGGPHDAKQGKHVNRAKAKSHMTRELRHTQHHGA